MRISSQIFNGVAEAVKGLFDVGAPVLVIKGLPEFFPVIRILEHFTGSGERKGTRLIQLFQPGKKFPFEFIPEDMDGDEKVLPGEPDLAIPCQAAAGNDAVHMHMIVQFLIPCV